MFMRITTFLHFVFKLLRKLRNTFVHIKVQRHLKMCIVPVYTRDWHSHNIANWNQYLSPLMGLSNINALEIGTFEGRSAIWLLEHVFTDPSASITCIDLFRRPGQEARFQHNIAMTKRTAQLIKRKGSSHNILPEFAHDSFDLIYVDGSHDAASVLLDAFLCWPILKPGGILIFDDYLINKNAPVSHTPKLAIDIFLDHHSDKCKVLHFDYQVILRKNRHNS